MVPVGRLRQFRAADLLELTDFTVAIRDNDEALVDTPVTLGTVVRTDATTGTKATKFEVPLTIAAGGIPSGTGKSRLLVRLNENVVSTLQKDLPSANGVTDVTVIGGANPATMFANIHAGYRVDT